VDLGELEPAKPRTAGAVLVTLYFAATARTHQRSGWDELLESARRPAAAAGWSVS